MEISLELETLPKVYVVTYAKEVRGFSYSTFVFIGRKPGLS